MPVEQILMFASNDGTTWPSEEAARTHNGLLALKEHLHAQFNTHDAEDRCISIIDVCKNFGDWYLMYLEGKST